MHNEQNKTTHKQHLKQSVMHKTEAWHDIKTLKDQITLAWEQLTLSGNLFQILDLDQKLPYSIFELNFMASFIPMLVSGMLKHLLIVRYLTI